jgi:hypothetical protein
MVSSVCLNDAAGHFSPDLEPFRKNMGLYQRRQRLDSRTSFSRKVSVYFAWNGVRGDLAWRRYRFFLMRGSQQKVEDLEATIPMHGRGMFQIRINDLECTG